MEVPDISQGNVLIRYILFLMSRLFYGIEKIEAFASPRTCIIASHQGTGSFWLSESMLDVFLVQILYWAWDGRMTRARAHASLCSILLPLALCMAETFSQSQFKYHLRRETFPDYPTSGDPFPGYSPLPSPQSILDTATKLWTISPKLPCQVT